MLRLCLLSGFFINSVFAMSNFTGAPKPYGPLPTKAQLQWHKMEYYAFAHFGSNTFTDREWGYGDESPEVFNPTDFDADQIIRTVAEAGMKGIILTAKHHDGFCLWPSQYTEYSVKNSPWKDGKGDVVKEFADACKKYGIKFGVYISPWDRNHPEYGKPGYIPYFRNQITELLTNYGEIFEIWFDGANGGDGYYGGARESRVIDRKTYYQWPGTLELIYQLQPNIIVESDLGPDVRWVGNEGGWANDPCWQTFTPRYRGTNEIITKNPQTGLYDYMPVGETNYQESTSGHRDGIYWMPAEACVSMRPGWFYHKSQDGQSKSPDELINIYYKTVGRGAALLLSVAPDQRGQLTDEDVKILQEMHSILDETFGTDIARKARAKASNVRGRDFSPAKAIDGKRDTYWSTDDGITSPELVLEFKKPITFNVVSIREYLPLGQRVDTWALDRWADGDWKEFAKGQAIGSRRLWRGTNITTEKVRLRLSGPVCPAINEFSLHKAPVRLSLPKITHNKDGFVDIKLDAAGPAIRYTLDGSEPTVTSTQFEMPFALPEGGTVKAAAFAGEKSSSVVTAHLGVSKSDWKVVSVTSLGLGCKAEDAIDADIDTFWHSWLAANPEPPQEIIVDMGKEINVGGFTYTPRTWGLDGAVTHYEFYLSKDGQDWTKSAVGEFSNIRNNPIVQEVSLDNPMNARYFKFVATQTLDNTKYVVITELGIIRN